MQSDLFNQRAEMLYGSCMTLQQGTAYSLLVAKRHHRQAQRSLGLILEAAQLLAQAIDSRCLLVDFLPLTGESTEPLQLAPEHEGALRSGHCVVEALHAYGEISHTQRTAALAALGPEHSKPLNRSISKDAVLLCTAGILELLASSGTLRARDACILRTGRER